MDRKGQLFSPVERRVSDAARDDLVTHDEAFSTIETLACEFGVHLTAVTEYLRRRGIPRRPPSGQRGTVTTEPTADPPGQNVRPPTTVGTSQPIRR